MPQFQIYNPHVTIRSTSRFGILLFRPYSALQTVLNWQNYWELVYSFSCPFLLHAVLFSPHPRHQDLILAAMPSVFGPKSCFDVSPPHIGVKGLYAGLLRDAIILLHFRAPKKGKVVPFLKRLYDQGRRVHAGIAPLNFVVSSFVSLFLCFFVYMQLGRVLGSRAVYHHKF